MTAQGGRKEFPARAWAFPEEKWVESEDVASSVKRSDWPGLSDRSPGQPDQSREFPDKQGAKEEMVVLPSPCAHSQGRGRHPTSRASGASSFCSCLGRRSQLGPQHTAVELSFHPLTCALARVGATTPLPASGAARILPMSRCAASQNVSGSPRQAAVRLMLLLPLLPRSQARVSDQQRRWHPPQPPQWPGRPLASSAR